MLAVNISQLFLIYNFQSKEITSKPVRKQASRNAGLRSFPVLES